MSKCSLMFSARVIPVSGLKNDGPLQQFIKQYVLFLGILHYHGLTLLGAVHMSWASPANRADSSHENLYFSTT